MSQRQRKHIPYPEQLAAALAPRLDEELRKALTEAKAGAAEVLRAFQLDHWPDLHADGGADKWFNLQWLLTPAHREKSRKDTSQVAKTKRIQRKQREHAEAMRAQGYGEHEPVRLRGRGIRGDTPITADMLRDGVTTPLTVKPKRWAKGRKLQSRPFERRGP